MSYQREVADVEAAIEALKKETDQSLFTELSEERKAACTGLELYGITKSVLQRFLHDKDLSADTRVKLRIAIAAVTRIYTS